jgi:hypothetical protein
MAQIFGAILVSSNAKPVLLRPSSNVQELRIVARQMIVRD